MFGKVSRHVEIRAKHQCKLCCCTWYERKRCPGWSFCPFAWPILAHTWSAFCWFPSQLFESLRDENRPCPENWIERKRAGVLGPTKDRSPLQLGPNLRPTGSWAQDRPNVGNMALHHQSQKRLELAVKMQVFSGLGNLGPTSTILNPTGAQVGAAWSCWAEAGPERSCWPVLTRSRANVAATSDRDGAFGRCWADLKRCKLPQSRALFGNGARANMVPHPKLHQSDRSVRLLPLLNYHASAPSVPADLSPSWIQE